MKTREPYRMPYASFAFAFAVGAALVSGGAWAGDSTWTGAVDGCWTNAANWTAGVPGRYVDATGATVGNTKETATFSSCTTGNTTIDLDGVVSIGGVTVTGADAPAYTFGTASDQCLPLEALTDGVNKFLVDKTVTTKQTVAAILGYAMNLDKSTRCTTIQNNSAASLEIHDIKCLNQLAKAEAHISFAGTGPIDLNGDWVDGGTVVGSDGNSVSIDYYAYFGSASTNVTFRKSCTMPAVFCSKAKNSAFRIASGVTVTSSRTAEWTKTSGNLPFTFDGDGTLLVSYKSWGNGGGDGDIDIRCRFAIDAKGGSYGVSFYNKGTFRLFNENNDLGSRLAFNGLDTSAALELEKIGNKGEGPLSDVTAICAANYFTLRFTGKEDDTTDRKMGIYKRGSWANNQNTFILDQSGTGNLTLTEGMELLTTPSDGLHKLILQGSTTGDGIWQGVLADMDASTKLQVTKKGTGRWIFTGAMTYSGATTVEEGTLALGAGGSLANSAVTVADGATFALTAAETNTVASLSVAGAAKLDIARQGTLVITQLTRAEGATVAVTVGAGAALVCADLAGTTPEWITVNGAAATFDADGAVRDTSLDDVVISGKTVGITPADGDANGVVTNFGPEEVTLIVKDGGAINVSGKTSATYHNGPKFGGKEVHFAGTGPDGEGALLSGDFYNFLLTKVTLDDDTTFACYKGANNSQGYIPFAKYGTTNAVFDMQGHTLTFNGNKGFLVFNEGTTVKNPGTIEVGKGSYLNLYTTADLGSSGGRSSTSCPIVLTNSTTIRAYGLQKLNRGLKIVSEFTTNPVNIVAYNASTSTNDYNFWGKIAFEPPKTVKSEGATASTDDAQLKISNGHTVDKSLATDIHFKGQVTGKGYISVGEAYRGDIYLEYENNGFYSKFTANDTGTFAYRFLYPQSLKYYNYMTVNGGRAVVYSPNWSAENIADFANIGDKKLLNDAVIAVNTEGEPDKTLTMELSDTVVTNGSFGIGHSDEGTLKLTGTWTKSVNVASYGGTLEISGSDAKNIAKLKSSSPLGQKIDSVVALTGGADLTLPTASADQWMVGAGLTSLTNIPVQHIARMKIKDATLTQADDSQQLAVGYGNEPGVLEIESGATVNATPLIGVTASSAVVGPGTGAIFQRGGTLKSTAADDIHVGQSSYSWGAYEMIGGTLDATGLNASGKAKMSAVSYGAQAAGVFHQSGGTAKFQTLHVGYASGIGETSATYYMTGGTAEADVLDLPNYSYSGKGSRSTLVIDGATADFEVRSGTGTIQLADANPKDDKTDYGTTASVNLLNGGTLHAAELSKYKGDIPASAVHAYANFDGGVFKIGQSGAAFGVWKTVNNVPGWFPIDRVTSYGKGAVISVDAGKTVTLQMPISAPEGNGVASVAWEGTAAAEHFYIGTPSVDIYGDGEGAAAVALFDATEGKVTGVKVVSPGVNYTKAFAVIRAASLNTRFGGWFTNDCVLTTSTPASGGITKAGEGTLILNVANTCTGATKVEAGTLQFGVDNAIPAGTDLVLAGGTLDLNGKTASFGRVSGAAGTVTGGTLSLTATELAYDCADILAGKTSIVNANVAFAEGATISFTNVDRLTKDVAAAYAVLTLNGTVANRPTVDVSNLPRRWTASWMGKTLKLRYQRPLMVTIK